MGVGWGCVCPHGKVGRQRWERRGVRPGIGDRPVSTDGGMHDVTTAWIGSGWVESGIGELNPCHQLGKLGHGRYTNPASGRNIIARLPCMTRAIPKTETRGVYQVFWGSAGMPNSRIRYRDLPSVRNTGISTTIALHNQARPSGLLNIYSPREPGTPKSRKTGGFPGHLRPKRIWVHPPRLTGLFVLSSWENLCHEI
jgi:hypothetical protein